MLKPLLFLIACLLSQLASAQVPNFFVDGSRWVYHTSESYEPSQQTLQEWDEQNIIRGDTLIAGVLYGKLYTTIHYTTMVFLPPPQPPMNLYSQDSMGPTFIRYDTFENKVFHLPNGDSTERIIYDFNLQLGDDTPLQSDVFLTTGAIDSIENESLFGISVKKFYTTKNEGGAVYEANYIIEGVGGSNGLLYYQPVFLVVSGGIYTTSLTCFQSGDSIYSPTNSDCPFLEFTSTDNPDSEPLAILVAPNPTRGVFSVLVGEELRDANFTVTDSWGRKIQSWVLSEQTSSGQLPSSGIYFWYLEKEGRFVKAGKIICE